MCANFNTNHVYLWWLLLQEYGPMTHYIQGTKIEATDVMSWLSYDDIFSQEHYE